ncbi:DUF2235 domain-containing protein [Bacillus subtilis]|nr:DUF2235 domain-containing protein [Pseudomonas sp. A29(2023)]MDL5601509.1 DUF2235 domain-containing protein [Bacillus subtilis]
MTFNAFSIGARTFAALILSGALGGCSGFFSGSRNVPISQSSMEELTSVLATEGLLEKIPRVNDKKPGTIVFVMSFDGTNNDREQVPEGETQTVVAQLFDRIEGNRADKPVQYPDSAIRKAYIRGPGCADSWPCALDAAFAFSSRMVAADAFAQLKQFIAQNPSATLVKVVVIGFSRGAATAKHFLNEVYDASAEHSLGTRAPVWSSAILIDTVATGQGDVLNLEFPPNLEFGLHLVAKNETRTLFHPIIDDDSKFERYAAGYGSRELGKRIFTVRLPGAHSDLGDSYDSGSGPQVTKIATNIIEVMGLKTPCLNDCTDDLPDLNAVMKKQWASGRFGGSSAMRLVSDGLHDSRGKLDHLLGAPSPYSKGFKREDDAVVRMAPMEKEQALPLFLRIRALTSDPLFDTGVMNEFSRQDNLVFRRKAGETVWKQDPVPERYKAVVGTSRRVPALIFKRGKIVIPDVVLQAIASEPGDVMLETVAFEGEYHWFVNGYIPGDK